MKYNWYLSNNNITKSDKNVLSTFILNSNRFTNGERVKEFEQNWSDWLDINHSVFVNSGASANYISMAMVKELVGIGEVIVPSLGWVSDVSSVVQLGFTPVFIDVNLNNFSLSSKNLENAITENTKAIVLVHGMGFNGLDDEIVQICKKHNLILIEDCCEAHGAIYGDKKVGTIGDISIFSFYYGHHITTIEGGMVCTNNEKLYNLAKMFRSHGMIRETSTEIQSFYESQYPNLNPLFTFSVAGFNMRSTEVNAVLGIEQLKRIDSVIKTRNRNFKVWVDNLDGELFYKDYNSVGISSFALPIVLNYNSRINLKIVCNLLDSEGIEYRIGTIGGGNQTIQPYLNKFNFRIFENLTNTEYIHFNGLYIGNHNEVSEFDIINLVKKLNNLKNENTEF